MRKPADGVIMGRKESVLSVDRCRELIKIRQTDIMHVEKDIVNLEKCKASLQSEVDYLWGEIVKAIS